MRRDGSRQRMIRRAAMMNMEGKNRCGRNGFRQYMAEQEAAERAIDVAEEQDNPDEARVFELLDTLQDDNEEYSAESGASEVDDDNEFQEAEVCLEDVDVAELREANEPVESVETTEAVDSAELVGMTQDLSNDVQGVEAMEQSEGLQQQEMAEAEAMMEPPENAEQLEMTNARESETTNQIESTNAAQGMDDTNGLTPEERMGLLRGFSEKELDDDGEVSELQLRHPEAWTVYEASNNWANLNRRERRQAIEDAIEAVEDLQTTLAYHRHKAPTDTEKIGDERFGLMDKKAAFIFRVLSVLLVLVISAGWIGSSILEGYSVIKIIGGVVVLSLFSVAACYAFIGTLCGGLKIDHFMMMVNRKNFELVASEVYRLEAMKDRRAQFVADAVSGAMPVLEQFWKWDKMVRLQLGWQMCKVLNESGEVIVRVTGTDVIDGGEYVADDVGYLMFRVDAVAMLKRKQLTPEILDEYERRLDDAPETLMMHFFSS